MEEEGEEAAAAEETMEGEELKELQQGVEMAVSPRTMPQALSEHTILRVYARALQIDSGSDPERAKMAFFHGIELG